MNGTVVVVMLFLACVASAAIAGLLLYLNRDTTGDTDGTGGGGTGGGGTVGGGTVGTYSAGGGAVGGDLPVADLKKAGGGAWNVQGRMDWKKSGVTTFQGSPVVRVFYGKGSGTSHHPGVGGIGFDCVPRGLPGTSAMMTFQLFFEPGWDFSGGGKMTGFRIGTGHASGGRHSATAASCRMSFKVGGGAWMYIYPPMGLEQVDPALRRDTGSGIGMFRDNFPPGTLKIGAWNDVKIGVRINTFDASGLPNADGASHLNVNGRTATLSNIRWSRSKDLVITAYNFTSFFGGSDPAKVDCAALFRNFKLSRY